MEWYEAAFDRFYPVLYGHRDEDEASLALGTFAPFIEDKSPVLDIASGNGRYLKTLLKAGHEAFGLDLSHYLLQRAAEDPELRHRLVQADMRDVPFRDESFGAAINMFTSFGYFSVDTDNLLVFREVSRILKPGGIFLFDFINASRISGTLLGNTTREAAGYTIEEHRAIEGHGKYLVKHATITQNDTGMSERIEERLRLYTKKDLETMFGAVRLEVRSCYGDYNGNEFVESVSDRIIIVCEKPTQTHR